MLDKLERKLGRFAVPHLMRYIIFGNALIYIGYLIHPQMISYLNLQPELVMKGQVWRLLTFALVPSLGSVLSTLLSLFCYFWIGESLERTLGAFQFNLYVLLGWLTVTVLIFVLYYTKVADLGVLSSQMSYFYQTLFIALAVLYPEMRILLFYFLPVKAKWVGILSAAFLVLEFVLSSFPLKLLMLACFTPFFVYFLPGWIRNLKAGNRRRAYSRKVSGQSFRQTGKSGSSGGWNGFGTRTGSNAWTSGSNGSNSASSSTGAQSTASDRNIRKVAFHRCTVCGITELDDPNMTFRYCSSCNGNYEYCEQHIHNHTHVE